MKVSETSFAIYCINIQCKHSIYNEIKPVWISLNIDNIVKSHICPECQKTMISGLDIEVAHLLTEASVSLQF